MTRVVHSGPYEGLYRSVDQLWSDEPGRMVRAAQTLMKTGRALDLGCGDGKNIVWLERCGWTVDGVDVSPSAIAAARRRVARELPSLRGSIRRSDAARIDVAPNSYAMVVAYGLYHCLDDAALVRAHTNAIEALTTGGLFVLAVIDDTIPIAPDHGTGRLYLREWSRLRRLFDGLDCLHHESAILHERHGEVVDWHEHSLQWAIFQK